MQGRLSPPINKNIQKFPHNHWKDEFSLARDIGFDLIEWVVDDEENPIFDDRQINEILELSSMVEHSVLKAIQALKNRDVISSQQVIDDDDLIDNKQAEIEEKCIQLIALQSPVAGDLRIIVSVMMIAIELERIGDYAEGIGKISVLKIFGKFFITLLSNTLYCSSLSKLFRLFKSFKRLFF